MSALTPYINSIVRRATPLWERKAIAASATIKTEEQKALIKQWAAVLNGPLLLKRRFDTMGVTQAQALCVLDSNAEPAKKQEWKNSFTAIVDRYHKFQEGSLVPYEEFRIHYRDIPFGEIFLPFLLYARQEVSNTKCISVLSTSARADNERALLNHLSFVSNATIAKDFYAFRFELAPLSALQGLWNQLSHGTEIYEEYRAEMYRRRFLQLLHRYPVLARLLTISVDQWISNTSAFCSRFEKDFPRICTHLTLTLSSSTAAIKKLRLGLSDRHHNGQGVIECQLSDGKRIIYKPRSVAPEIAFNRLLSFVNTLPVSLPMKTFRSLDSITYGWTEYVPFLPCERRLEVAHFYTRAGMLLSILHLLAITDIHFENLIACGADPMVIDLETMLDEVLPGNPKRGRLVSPLSHTDTVQRTGMLPFPLTKGEKKGFDLSALGADQSQHHRLRVSSWEKMGTDGMRLVKSKAILPLQHRVRYRRQLPNLHYNLPYLMAGFKEMYYLLLENKKLLLDQKKLLKNFDGLNLRVLLRNTENYVELQRHALQPQYLTSGTRRSMELEWLARPLCGTTLPEKGRVMVGQAEIKAMERLDVPHFTTSKWKQINRTTTDLDLLLLGRKRDSALIRKRLQKMSMQDCRKQERIIRAAVHSRFKSGKGAPQLARP